MLLQDLEVAPTCYTATLAGQTKGREQVRIDKEKRRPLPLLFFSFSPPSCFSSELCRAELHYFFEAYTYAPRSYCGCGNILSVAPDSALTSVFTRCARLAAVQWQKNAFDWTLPRSLGSNLFLPKASSSTEYGKHKKKRSASFLVASQTWGKLNAFHILWS